MPTEKKKNMCKVHEKFKFVRNILHNYQKKKLKHIKKIKGGINEMDEKKRKQEFK